MSSMFGQKDDSEGESDEVDSQTATFPLMNQLFGGGFPKPAKQPENAETKEREPKKEKKSKHKFLDNYCMDLTAPGPGRASWTRSSAGTWRRNGSSRS